jgi:hypothetical protein
MHIDDLGCVNDGVQLFGRRATAGLAPLIAQRGAEGVFRAEKGHTETPVSFLEGLTCAGYNVCRSIVPTHRIHSNGYVFNLGGQRVYCRLSDTVLAAVSGG